MTAKRDSCYHKSVREIIITEESVHTLIVEYDGKYYKNVHDLITRFSLFKKIQVCIKNVENHLCHYKSYWKNN